MMMRRILVPAFALCLLTVFTACECWEDIWDGNKPPPDTPLAKQAETPTAYTREEAVDRIVHKLIMRFSRYSRKPSVKLTSWDGLSIAVFNKLRNANAVGRSDAIRFEEMADGQKVCFRAVDESTGKMIYEENFILKP